MWTQPLLGKKKDKNTVRGLLNVTKSDRITDFEEHDLLAKH